MTRPSFLRLVEPPDVEPAASAPPPVTTSKPKAKARKRPDGEGSVYELPDGRWCAKLPARRGTDRRKQFTAKTRTEVIAKRNAYQRDATLRGGAPEADPRLDRWLDTWLADVKQRCAPNTYKARVLSARHIVVEIGKLHLSSITPADVDAMLRAMVKADRAVATVNLDRDALVAALNVARKRRVLIGDNPASLASRIKQPRRDLKLPSADDVSTLFDVVREHRLFAAFVVVAKLGLRNAEVCGLRWTDLALDAAKPTLSVTGQILRIDRVLTRTPPKAGSSGVLALGADVVDVLRAHCARQAAERVAAGTAWLDVDQMVFTQEDGALMYGAALTGLFKRALARAGLPTARPVHTLRHFVGTVIADKVGPKAAQQALRHKSMATTIAYYCHATPEAMEQAVAAMSHVQIAPRHATAETNTETNTETNRETNGSETA